MNPQWESVDRESARRSQIRDDKMMRQTSNGCVQSRAREQAGGICGLNTRSLTVAAL